MIILFIVLYKIKYVICIPLSLLFIDKKILVYLNPISYTPDEVSHMLFSVVKLEIVSFLHKVVQSGCWHGHQYHLNLHRQRMFLAHK